MSEIESDYLVVGAGAAGLAFTGALLSHSSATITIVDRRDAPGGHWRDAYPYVRLHQPSAFYGVDTIPLGSDRIDTTGTNAGFYELAGADEIRAYFERVMREHFLPTGRVRYLPSSDHAGNRVVSRLTGASTEVRAGTKLVDTTYLEGTIPATSPPPFTVGDGVRCVSAGDLARLDPRPERFVVIGGGKTALDACVWLLEHDVPPSKIQWVRPRDAWCIDRKLQQPSTLVPDLYLGVAMQIEAMANAVSVDDLFARLERAGIVVRIDPHVTPTMFRGAIVSEGELALLRTITDVVRMGHVRAIERDAIVLEHGRVPTDEQTVHVHCAAQGLARPPLRPIFEPGRVTVQPFMYGFACYQFAALGVIEATLESDDEKNRLCPPIPYWDAAMDYVTAFRATLIGDRVRGEHPAFATWSKATRLNPTSGVSAYREDPRVVDARDRIKRFGGAAVANLGQLAAHTKIEGAGATTVVPPFALAAPARTIREMQLVATLQPCPSCSAYNPEPLAFERFDGVWRGNGTCPRCSAKRVFDFTAKGDPTTTRHGRFDLGPLRSHVLTPEDLLRAYDAAMARILKVPFAEPPVVSAAVTIELALAKTLVTELFKLLPLGAETVPEAKDERAARTWISGELKRLSVALGRHRPPPTLSDAAIAAHHEWNARGAKGEGQLVLRNARMRGEQYHPVKWDFVEIYASDLTDVDLAEGKLPFALLEDVVFAGANLRAISLTDARIQGGRWTHATLGSIQLANATITGTDFSGSDMEGATFINTRVTGARFDGVRFGSAALDGAVFQSCTFRDASLAKYTSKLPTSAGARFIDCDLSGTEWTEHDLTRATFTRCTFTGARGKPHATDGLIVEECALDAAALVTQLA